MGCLPQRLGTRCGLLLTGSAGGGRDRQTGFDGLDFETRGGLVYGSGVSADGPGRGCGRRDLPLMGSESAALSATSPGISFVSAQPCSCCAVTAASCLVMLLWPGQPLWGRMIIARAWTTRGAAGFVV